MLINFKAISNSFSGMKLRIKYKNKKAQAALKLKYETKISKHLSI